MPGPERVHLSEVWMLWLSEAAVTASRSPTGLICHLTVLRPALRREAGTRDTNALLS